MGSGRKRVGLSPSGSWTKKRGKNSAAECPPWGTKEENISSSATRRKDEKGFPFDSNHATNIR